MGSKLSISTHNIQDDDPVQRVLVIMFFSSIILSFVYLLDLSTSVFSNWDTFGHPERYFSGFYYILIIKPISLFIAALSHLYEISFTNYHYLNLFIASLMALVMSVASLFFIARGLSLNFEGYILWKGVGCFTHTRMFGIHLLCSDLWDKPINGGRHRLAIG